MPELPEVETIAGQLRKAILGARIRRVIVGRRDIVRSGGRGFAQALRGRFIRSIDREGKRLLFDVGDDVRLVFHLGMSGRITLDRPGGRPAPHTHLRVLFAGRPVELRFRDPRRFGGVWLVPARRGQPEGRLKRLGPDALAIRVPVLRRLLRRDRQVKALLMDQQVIAGLGNIYCDESLFAAGIHPRTKASRLSEPQVRRLACAIRKTLRRSLNAGGSTLVDYRQTDGREGAFQRMVRVYGRAGLPCRRCGGPIRRIVAAGRTTHVCPRCQPVATQARRTGTRPLHGSTRRLTNGGTSAMSISPLASASAAQNRSALGQV